jgi:hypothetical protein
LGSTISFNKKIKILYVLKKKQVAIVMSLTILEMVIVMTKITTMTAISMAATVVDQMLTPNIVRNVFVMNKPERTL